MTEELKKARKECKDAHTISMAMDAVKTVSLDAMGMGKKNGGPAHCREKRFEVLERIRANSDLSAEQRNDWGYFKTQWDKEMASIHSEDWAQIFSEYIQHILDEMHRGRSCALSDFMHRETKRVLGSVPTLVIPGV